MDELLSLWNVPGSIDKLLKPYTGKVVTRFPPEPSGYLHIGHAKALFFNYVLAKKYGGIMIMRFDDTNPIKESVEFEEAILDDIKRLGIVFDKITKTSDYFDQMLSYAQDLIDRGLAYVDNTDHDEISKQRFSKTDSVNRNNTTIVNMRMWEDMCSGKLVNCCLRLKISMTHKNAAMRDPTIYRCLSASHHNTENKYNVYPTYDFACPLVDSIEGVTHVFRASDFSDRDEQYEYILDKVGLRIPSLNIYGKINFKDTVLGKRNIKKLIEDKVISGWDDPKILTIRGLLNRGMHVSGIQQFIATVGFSKNASDMTEDKMWTINKKYIDKIATRFTALSAHVKLTILDHIDESDKVKDIYKFAKNTSLGYRKLHYSNEILISKEDYDEAKTGDEITLMNWCNTFIDKENMTLKLNKEGDFKTTKLKVLWLTANNENVNVNIIKYTGLHDQPIVTTLIGEAELKNINKYDYVQFMKMNYCMCSEKYDGATNSITFVDHP